MTDSNQMELAGLTLSVEDSPAKISVQPEGRPELGRVAHGVPDRTHRVKALGNAVVPQIPEIIGRAIMEAERVAA